MESSPTQPLNEAASGDVASPISISTDPPSNTRRCIICLVDEPEDSLPADWSTPCTCTIEGHHECIMKWVVDLEAKDKEIKCAICKSPITITQKRDPIVQASEYLTATCYQWSWTVMQSFVAYGALVSSSYYGARALDFFAGPEATLNFILVTDDATTMATIRQPTIALREHNQASINLLHLSMLSLIAPGLILNRLYFSDTIFLPASVLYAVLLGNSNEYLTWPPSPQRALTIYPSVKAVYFNLHKVVSENLEKRWQEKAREIASSIAPPVAQHDQHQEQENERPQAGYGNILRYLRRPANEIEVVGGRGANNNLNRRPRWDRRPGGDEIWSVNIFAGALVWPGVCFGAGELLRLALPARFVSRPAAGPITGILQERWGRSLVGGCLFVVLKDTFWLWIKYRQIMNRARRRVKNAENRRVR
ncbi:hypothetical protein GGR54DRAFT_644176 [Hypoxylon sp. NC1633]|nr:hypothetical protein GGR54DRAFT_644176 [Hypoxylon sp. NC1633]